MVTRCRAESRVLPSITVGNKAAVFACLAGKCKSSWTLYVVGDLKEHVENIAISLRAAGAADKCKPARMTWHAPPYEYSGRSFDSFPVHVTVNWKSGVSTAHVWPLELSPGDHSITIPVPEEVLSYLTRKREWKNLSTRRLHENPHQPRTLHFDPSAPLEALVLYNYKPLQGDEIKLVRGERVQLLHRADENWLWGRSVSGAVGLFPAGYVQPIEPSVVHAAAALTPAGGNSSTRGEHKVAGGRQPHFSNNHAQYNTYIHHRPSEPAYVRPPVQNVHPQHAPLEPSYVHPVDHVHQHPQHAPQAGSLAPTGYERKLRSPGFMHYEGHGYSHITL